DAKAITQTQYYETLEREIIPQWHAARLQLDGVTVASESRLRLEKLRTYAWLEEDELQSLSDMLRAGKAYDEDARKAFADKQSAPPEARRDLQADLKQPANCRSSGSDSGLRRGAGPRAGGSPRADGARSSPAGSRACRPSGSRSARAPRRAGTAGSGAGT